MASLWNYDIPALNQRSNRNTLRMSVTGANLEQSPFDELLVESIT